MAQTKIKAGLFEGIIGNGTDGYFLMSNGDGTMAWSSIIINPTISSIAYPGSVTAADPVGGETITVTGTGFKTGATVTIGGTAAPAVSYVSETQITFTTPAKAAGDYDIVVTNTDGGTATFVDGISYNGIPSWTTASGSLGTFASDTTISTITLQASEPDAGTITFNITSGALPTGLSLTGTDIDGTTSKETADTLYNFTVTAIDDENQSSTPRAFSITVEKWVVPAPENFEIVTYTGNGGTQAITSKIGTAASFNGSSSYIDLGSTVDDPLRTAGEFGVSLWFNADSYGTNPVIFKLLNDTYVYIFLNGSNQLECRVVDSSDTSRVVTTSVSLNTWYHVVWTGDSTNGVTLYLNGSSVGNTSWNGTFLTYTNSSYKFNYLGYNGSNTGWYTGKIDQVRIFDKAISSSEVTTLYGESNTSTTKSTTDIFDDGSGVALYEFEGGAKDTGGVTGKFGGGATFSSTSVSKVNTGIGSLATNFSVFMWVKIQDISVANSFFGNWNATTADDIYLSHNTDGQLRLGIDGVSNQYFGANGDITENTWHHIGFTFSNGTVTAYIDGSNKGTTTTSNTSFSSGLPFVIGSYSSRTDANGYDVTIDDVRIYSDVLTSQEVGYLYNNTTASIPTDNLTAYYKFEGNSNDEQGNYDGTDSNVTYRYDGTPTNINFLGMAFQPDLVWIKNRFGYAHNHNLIDSVRGASSKLFSNLTNAEVSTGGLASFDSNGFSFDSSSGNDINEINFDFVAWCWKAGGAAVSNTDGTIPSTVSANPDAGFSIVKWTTTSAAAWNVGHGLSSAPEMIISKMTSFGNSWEVYHKDTGTGKYLQLHTTAAIGTDAGAFSSVTDTTWTSYTTNTLGDYIAYCFTSVTGYQKIGSYQGTGIAGNAVTTGFRPRWIMIKNTASGYSWIITDSVRQTGKILYPNLSNAEFSLSTGITSFDSDGFTLGSDVSHNNSGDTFIYLAIA